MKNKRLPGMVFTVVLLLLIPLIAMQYTDEVNWGLADFAVAGILLLGTGVMIDFVIRRVPGLGYRIAICAAIVALLLVVWAELAVGIFGTALGGT
jgi:hypothetical protein